MATITQQEFNEMYKQAEDAARKIGAFMNYLNRTETQGRKLVQASLPKSKPKTQKQLR
jgi:hypothetical protein